MKKYILSGCLLAALTMTTTSCSDFLTEDPQGKLPPQGFFKTQAELDLAVNSLYAKIQEYQCNSNTTILQTQGDDVTSTTGSNKAAYLSADGFEVPSDQKGINDLWNKAFGIVKAANLVINGGKDIATTNEEARKEAMGQGYFWRAYAYFTMVRIWGELPIVLTADIDMGGDNALKKESVENVYKQIVSDLEEAEKCGLPAQYPGAPKIQGEANVFVSIQAVKSTLAAVYMNMAGFPLNKTEYYAKAADKAKEVIDGVNAGTYKQSLQQWADIYNYGKNHHNEAILGIDYMPRYGGWNSWDSQFSSCHQLQSVSGGWGDFLPERKFWLDFPDGPRKQYVFAPQITFARKMKVLDKDGNVAEKEAQVKFPTVDWWATTDGEARKVVKDNDGKVTSDNACFSDYRPMYIGFTIQKDPSTGQPYKGAYNPAYLFWDGMCIDKRHQLIRYSEVLLWFAESAARSGKYLTEARKALKDVRQRAYNPGDPAVTAVDGMDGNALAEAAYKEHGWEVAGNMYSLVTRRADQFRMNRLKETFDYRRGEQKDILVPKGTLTHSYRLVSTGKKDDKGNDIMKPEAFTYTLKEDVVLKEEYDVKASSKSQAWDVNTCVYQVYPINDQKANPNLVGK